MSRFCSKPVEIEADQLTPEMIEAIVLDEANPPNGLVLAAANFHRGDRTISSARFICRTRQGDVRPEVGDWLIQESDGSGCYPCKPDVFEAKYEPISA